jgi:hypothetical protein
MKNITLLFAVLLLVCCKKETTVQGTARQTISERVIPFATLFIEEDVGSRTNRISTTTADANGQYKITFSAKKNGTYGLSGMAPQCDNRVQFIDLTNGKTNHLDFHLPAFGTLKVHALRHGSDTLWLGRSVLAPDTVFTWPIHGNEQDNFVYVLQHNGNFISNSKPCYVAGFDTLRIQLDY